MIPCAVFTTIAVGIIEAAAIIGRIEAAAAIIIAERVTAAILIVVTCRTIRTPVLAVAILVVATVVVRMARNCVAATGRKSEKAKTKSCQNSTFYHNESP